MNSSGGRGGLLPRGCRALTTVPRPSVRLLSLLLRLVGATAVPVVAGQLPGEQLARQRIRDLERAAAAGDTRRVQILAFEISSDYRARRLLETPEFEDIGRLYFDSWFEQGDGLIHDVISRAKRRLAAELTEGGLARKYPDEILELIEVVQNEQSRLLKQAPMDFEIGILTRTRDQAVDILHRLGGPSAVSEFHARLQEALEEAYVELYRSLGGTGAVSARCFAAEVETLGKARLIGLSSAAVNVRGRCSRRTRFVGAIAILLMPAAVAAPARSAHAQGAPSTAVRMQRVVAQLVERTGYRIVGVGSWISGARYGDVLNAVDHISDHDMRLLMPRGASPGAASNAWAAARRQLIDLLQAEFGGDAARVLAQTNLYPPAQLMGGVEAPADALAVFVEHNQVPNLGYQRRVTAATPAHFAEGLYGPGANAYTQSYERTAGRLFYRYQGEVYQGLTDLTHFGEGPARYTIRGTANTAMQWSQHATDALRSGDPQAVIKHLSRYARDITKCRSLARLPLNGQTGREVSAMAAQLADNPALLRQSRGAIQSLLQRAQLEAALLGHLESANPLSRAAARVALDGIEAGSELGSMLRRASEKFPGDAVARLLVLSLGTYMVSRNLGEDDIVGLYDSAVTTVSGLVPATTAAEFMAAMSPAAMVTLTHLLLEQVRAGGYDAIAGRQEAFNLLDGIFANGQIADRRYSIDDLVRNIHTEAGIKGFVFARSREAADRGFGPENLRHDLSTAEAIYRHCLPTILQAWLWRRAELIGELELIGEGLEESSVLLAYRPNPAVPEGGAANVTVTAVPLDDDEGTKLARCREILRILLGATQPVYANVITTWVPAGAGDSSRPERSYRLPAGEHEIQFEESIGIGAANLPYGSRLSRSIVRKASVTVRVGDRAATPPLPVPPPAGGMWRPPIPEITADRLGTAWTVDGPYHQEGQPYHWSLVGAQAGQRVSLEAFAMYGDGPVDELWQWNAGRQRLEAGKARSLAYGDEARDLSIATANDYQRMAILLVRWGLLIVEVRASGADLATLDAAARVVLENIARQLEPLRPTDGRR